MEKGGHAGAGPSQAIAGKMKDLASLGELCERARRDGETIVLAHGVFDLLHMGHVRHLQEARSHGSRLVVTITPDRFVNKGPHRPVFSELLRLEMLAALSFVDLVAVNTSPSGEAAIEVVRPHVYVKGGDYINPEDDVTGKINDEKALVERYGGKVVFTQDITFSSTELINRHLNPFTPAVRVFLDEMRAAGEADLGGLFDALGKLKVLVVGDTILDEYRYVRPMSKTPKENLVATLHQFDELFAGGVLATANHVASLCDQVDVLTVFGDDEDYTDFIKVHMRSNVTIHAAYRAGFPMTRKTRYVDQYSMRKLFEVYHMDDTDISGDVYNFISDFLRKSKENYDLIIVNDFGHGMISEGNIKNIVDDVKFLAVNTQTNSANFGFNLITKYPKADYVCIDGAEARLAMRDKQSPMDILIREKLASSISCPRIIVTQGAQGCTGYALDEAVCEVPAFADKVIDTVGAGDAFLAVSAPVLAAGGTLRQAAFIGNIAGALKVGIVGHRSSIEKAALLKAISSLLR